MVKTQKALIISGASAVVVGILHFAAHAIAPAEHAVVVAGTTVVVSVFLIGFIGMKLGR